VSTINCNKDTKCNAKIRKKIIVLSHPLGDLRVTHNVYLWLDGKRIVDIIIIIIIIIELNKAPLGGGEAAP